MKIDAEGKRVISLTTKWLGSAWGIALAGVCLGGIGAYLSKFSGAKNTGFCITGFLGDLFLAIFPTQTGTTCFCSIQRDAGMQQLNAADFIRPEYLGLVLGSFLAALLFREFKARAGSGTPVRFLLGMAGMIGVLVFWGCPVRTLLRLGGGDLSALIGLAGLSTGIGIAILMSRSGFELGKSKNVHPALGLIVPIVTLGALIWVIFTRSNIALPRAPLAIALGAGGVVGFLAQRSRLCMMSSIRNVFLMRSPTPLLALFSVFAGALVINSLFGQVHWGFTGQPFAHSNIVWGFLGMVVAGISFTLTGACPTRQLFLTGEGNVDSVVFLLGMLAGTWITQQVGLSVSPDTAALDVVLVGGPNMAGKVAVIVSLAICVAVGMVFRNRQTEVR